MPIRWSNSANTRPSPMVSAFLTSMSKTSRCSALKRATQLPVSSSAARKSTSTNSSAKWASRNGAQNSSNQSYGANRSSYESFRNNLSTFASLSKNIAIAGTGTAASTMLALYLATVVEKSAHELLYECFPEKYFLVRDEDLPECLKERELTRRLLWGQLEDVDADMMEADHKAPEVEHAPQEEYMTGKMIGFLADPTQMMDVFMDDHNENVRIQEAGKSVGQIIKEEEQIFEKQLSRNNELDSESAVKRWSSWGEPTLFSLYRKKNNASSKSKSSQLLEAKRFHEETRLLQERLMSVAMTA
mmetsp:Transcript_6333/g.13784  ORF Transcript_6333/g.13784 Transcript_6333/m.13784 type:complete len:302 (-) Transcript_6333:254-1159(-)